MKHFLISVNIYRFALTLFTAVAVHLAGVATGSALSALAIITALTANTVRATNSTRSSGVVLLAKLPTVSGSSRCEKGEPA